MFQTTNQTAQLARLLGACRPHEHQDFGAELQLETPQWCVFGTAESDWLEICGKLWKYVKMACHGKFSAAQQKAIRNH